MTLESAVNEYFERMWELGQKLGEEGITYSPKIKVHVNGHYDDNGIYTVTSYNHVNYRQKSPNLQAYLGIDDINKTEAFNQIFAEMDKVIQHDSAKKESLKLDLDFLAGQALFKGCNNSPKSDAAEMGKRFIDYALRRPMRFHNTAYLSGLAVPEKNVNLGAGISIRRTGKEDFELVSDPLEPRPGQFSFFNQGITCAMEFDISGDQIRARMNVDEELRRYTAILRLFASSPVWSLRREGAGLGTTISTRYVGRSVYKLSEEKISDLLAFWNAEGETHIKRLMNNREDYLAYSFNQYSELVVFQGPPPLVVGQLIAILESIYKFEERSNSSTVKQRASKLLGLVGFNPLEVHKTLNDAYSIRNKVFHGEATDAKTNAEATELTRSLFDYVRLSILIFLYVADKKNFLKTLSDSLLDHSLEEKIRVVLKGNELLPLQSTKIAI